MFFNRYTMLSATRYQDTCPLIDDAIPVAVYYSKTEVRFTNEQSGIRTTGIHCDERQKCTVTQFRASQMGNLQFSKVSSSSLPQRTQVCTLY